MNQQSDHHTGNTQASTWDRRRAGQPSPNDHATMTYAYDSGGLHDQLRSEDPRYPTWHQTGAQPNTSTSFNPNYPNRQAYPVTESSTQAVVDPGEIRWRNHSAPTPEGYYTQGCGKLN